MIVDLGCGNNKVIGAYGIDLNPGPGVDVVADVSADLPFRTGSVHEIHAYNILEHFVDFIPLMREMHRVLRIGGRLFIRVPHYSSRHAWTDPTHKRCFALRTFDYFSADHHLGYYFDFHFDLIQTELRVNASDTPPWPLSTLFKIYANIINRLTPLYPGLFERFACFIGYDELIVELKRA